MADRGLAIRWRGGPEAALAAAGSVNIAGVDEAGRGPLAGPVVTAAVVFRGRVPRGIDDSKKLTASRREELFEAIHAAADVSVAMASPATIDRLNIRGATLFAMARAIAGLERAPCHVLVDGRDTPPGAWPMSAVIGGDGLSLSIGAASIVAKVTRDRIMQALDRRFPVYGFAVHKGYATAMHREAIRRHGPCPHHRMSFAPCAGEAPDTDC